MELNLGTPKGTTHRSLKYVKNLNKIPFDTATSCQKMHGYVGVTQQIQHTVFPQ
jgi:hypothetical protein